MLATWRQILIGGLSLLIVGSALLLVMQGVLRERPTLDRVSELARAGRLVEANRLGEAYLATEPDDARGVLVIAELALSGPKPDSGRALEILARARPDSAELAAWIDVDRGRAYAAAGDYARAEACWKRSIGRDQMQGEARRRLIDLYTIQGRATEARLVLMQQLEMTGAWRDRVTLLVRLARLEVDPPDAWDVIHHFEPVISGGKADVYTTVAYGLSLARVSRGDPACSILKSCLERYPEDPMVWDGYLEALELAKRDDDVVEAWGVIPGRLRADPRFAKHLGRVEQSAGRWKQAGDAYRRAWQYDPDHSVGYRLVQVLLLAGEREEARRYETVVGAYRSAYKTMRGLFDRYGVAIEDEAQKGEFRARMAEACTGLMRPEQAAAWRWLIVRDDGGARAHLKPR